MIMPAFAAEASLYKSTSSYRAYSPRTGRDTAPGVVVANSESDCAAACVAEHTLALIACGALGPFGIVCQWKVWQDLAHCLQGCESVDGGGGGGGGVTSCCPVDPTTGLQKRCCGTCEVGPDGRYRCNDACVGPGEKCP
jgi:hypothetical protein